MTEAIGPRPNFVFRLDEGGPLTRITVEIPVSYFNALKAWKWSRKKSQGEIVTEALRLLFSGEIKPIDQEADGWWRVKRK